MSKHGLWTIIIDDKTVIKKTEEFSISSVKALKIDNDSFWSQSKFNNIHAIQFSDDGVDNDQVEYKDNSPNSSYDENILGNFRTEFISKWDSVYLTELQHNWDNNDKDTNGEILVDETVEAKTIRLGARPTSYTSA
jgi:hypothetical protein|tara:strand:+ start:2063 stop:2470 length:408 start_codon:yes stop_codon:yes gene_type:complete